MKKHSHQINRKSPEYKLWRANVYASDSWTCVLCSKKAKRIEAHHIYPVRDYPEKALDPSNGVTLCFACHRVIFGKEHLLVDYFAALKANRVNSVKVSTSKTGNRENTEPSLGRNALEGVTTRSRVFKIEQFISRQVQCVICKKSLMRHYYRTQRSKIFFCSRECRGVWCGKTIGGNNRKEVAKRQCGFCKKNLKPTPSSKHRVKKFCDNSCQAKYLWRVQGRKKPKILNGRWTIKYTSCVGCGTKAKPHYGKGSCMTCYNKSYNARVKRQ